MSQHQMSDELPPLDPQALIDAECVCQDQDRCPVHHGYD